MPVSLDQDVVRALVRAAVRAASSHNTQPWTFRRADGDILLYADTSRALPVNDPQNRELHLSCGAALMNLRVAARHHGLAADASLLPDPAEDLLLARIALSESHLPPSGADTALYDAIARRRTHRKPFTQQPLPVSSLMWTRQAVEQEGARLHIISRQRRPALARLVEEDDRRQFADRAWRREVAQWLRPYRSGDGLTVPAWSAPALRVLLRHVNLGARIGSRDAGLLLSAPAVAVLSTAADGRSDWLLAGQALQRGLLVLAADGVLAAYANQPCQVGGSLRDRLRDALPDPRGHPQILMRVGYPAAAVRQTTPRRPLGDVLNP